MSTTFRVTAEPGTCFTRNAGPVSFPTFFVPVQFLDRRTGLHIPRHVDFLWDTAASFGVISRQMADDFNLRIDDTLDRVEGGMDGLGGTQEAWLTTATIRFSLLTRSPRYRLFGKCRPVDLHFKFNFLVVDSVGLPLLGTGDMLRNFTSISTWEECVFQLASDHLGSEN